MNIHSRTVAYFVPVTIFVAPLIYLVTHERLPFFHVVAQ